MGVGDKKLPAAGKQGAGNYRFGVAATDLAATSSVTTLEFVLQCLEQRKTGQSIGTSVVVSVYRQLITGQ